MLLYSTPPLHGCSCLHKVKGSNESSSFPLFLYFLFNYSQAVQVLLYFPSPYAALSSWGFFIPNCAFGLSPISFSSVRAPCSAKICCLCNLRCAHMLALPLSSPPPPASGPPSVPSLHSSIFARGPISQPEKEQFCYGHCSRFHAAGSSPPIKGNP